MILKWTSDRYNQNGSVITPENANEHSSATADFGAIRLNIGTSLRTFKNGARNFQVYLHVPGAISSEWITLVRGRGHLLDAISAAETFLFGNPVYGIEEYRLPAESASIVERTNAMGGTP